MLCFALLAIGHFYLHLIKNSQSFNCNRTGHVSMCHLMRDKSRHCKCKIIYQCQHILCFKQKSLSILYILLFVPPSLTKVLHFKMKLKVFHLAFVSLYCQVFVCLRFSLKTHPKRIKIFMLNLTGFLFLFLVNERVSQKKKKKTFN